MWVSFDGFIDVLRDESVHKMGGELSSKVLTSSVMFAKTSVTKSKGVNERQKRGLIGSKNAHLIRYQSFKNGIQKNLVLLFLASAN